MPIKIKETHWSTTQFRKELRKKLSDPSHLTRLLEELAKLEGKAYIDSVLRIYSVIIPPLKPVAEDAEGNYKDEPPTKYVINVHPMDFSEN